jgi:MoxR-like ATPase
MNENISQQPASVKPVFLHHDKVLEGLNMIFGSSRNSVKISDPDVLEILRIIPITPDSISLLSGIMGTGKTTYAQAFTQVFFGKDSLGMIKCDPEKTPHETLYGTDVASETSYTYDSNNKLTGTREMFVFDPQALAFVTKPVKFANEISRSGKAVQDALLGLFQEGEIEYRGKIFKTEKPFIALLDQNPLHLQGMGARELEPALVDRIDVSISIPTTSMFDDLAIQQNKESENELKPILDYEIMKEVFADIRKVRKQLSIKFLVVVMSQSLRACKYRKDISSPIFIESIDCTRCEFKNDICNAIEAPTGFRHVESILKFASSRAWLDKREEISLKDIIAVMPFALSHRLKLKSKAYMDSESTYSWIKEKALPFIIKQLNIYQEMLDEYIQTLNGSKNALISISMKCGGNLLYQQMVHRLGEQLLTQGNKEMDALELSLLNLNDPERSELEHMLAGISDLKITTMVSSLTLKELNDIESQTEMLNRYELEEKVSRDPKGGKDKKDITYQKINPLIKNIKSLIQRHDKIENVIKQALTNTKFEIQLSETDFMKKVFPKILKYLDKKDILEFGQNQKNMIAQTIGNVKLQIGRIDDMVTLSLESDDRKDLSETKRILGL